MRNWRALLRLLFLTAGAAAFAVPHRAFAVPRVIVHEWGTFTSLQDEKGESIGWVNADDEPVPSFVHQLKGIRVAGGSAPSGPYSKGLPILHRDVVMRLETPVIYFHLAPGVAQPVTLDVRARFKGGWLSQFYPRAEAKIEGDEGLDFRKLGPASESSLAWRELQIGAKGAAPETESRVWLAPRAVDAADLKTPEGEGERYLFYRGVGSVKPPLRVERDASSGDFQLRSALDAGVANGRALKINQLWLIESRIDGTLAYRTLPAIELGGDVSRVLASAPPYFSKQDFEDTLIQDQAPAAWRNGNLSFLRAEMKAALIGGGLFEDEAEAMLNTWEASYFKSPGLRLFFLLPREWTDHYLPLEISEEAKIERVMMGRIELVSPAHRAILEGMRAIGDAARKGGSPELGSVLRQMRAHLGRFGDAMILHEHAANPNGGMKSVRYALNIHPFTE